MPYQFGVPEDIIDRVCQGKLRSSAYSSFMSVLHDKHVIGVNNAYQIGPWLDFVFFGDGSWFLVHQNKLAMWPGIKVSCAPRFNGAKGSWVKYVSKFHGHKHGISDNPSKVCWNDNSGAASISLAHHLGAKKIYLLGFDMTMDGKFSHWHGNHGKVPKKGFPYARHLLGFNQIARDAKKMGIKIFVVNKGSAIKTLPVITLQEALNG